MKHFKHIKILLAAIILIMGFTLLPTNTVWGASQQAEIKSCKINVWGNKIKVKAKVKEKTSSMGKKLYLLGLEPYSSENSVKGVTPLASVKAKRGSVSFKIDYDSTMLYKKYALAYKSKGAYKIISNCSYITNPEAVATYRGAEPKPRSKKGLQVEELSDSLEIGTKHAVINWTLSSILTGSSNSHAIAFPYQGVVYYLDENVLKANDKLVQAYNQAGVKVTIILLLPEDSSGATASMRYSGPATAQYSAIKTGKKAGCRTFEAVMTFLAKRYGTESNLVSGWILGNEVNSPCVWNYGGGKKQSSYINNYARSFRICYNAVKSVNANANVYISLDHNWNTDPDGKGSRYFSSKSTLDAFYKRINNQGKIVFRIAYHAYPQGLSDPVFWDDSNASNSTSAKIVNFKNLNVLTNYVKKNYGKKYKIMLSEQSFNSNKGEVVQAAAYAYAYYLSETNGMIESFIYGREFDHEKEAGYNWGLCTKDHAKRLIWSVFQYIDTADSFKFTDPLVSSTNLKSWKKIKNFKKNKFKDMPSIRNVQPVITLAESTGNNEITIQWDKINTGDGYEIFRLGPGDGAYILIGRVSGNSTVSFKDSNVVPGNLYSYQVRMYKEAPTKQDPNKRENLYSPISGAVSVTSSTAQVQWNPDKCDVDGKAITIGWKKVAGASGYEVYRSTQKDGGYALIGGTVNAKYTDTNTVSGTTYYYKVRAYVTVAGRNFYGKESVVMEQTANIQLNLVSVGSGKVTFNWSQWQDQNKYRIYCAQGSGSFKKITLVTSPVSPNTFSWSGDTYKNSADASQAFVSGVTYRFRVRAVLENGKYSPYSNIVEVTFP